MASICRARPGQAAGLVGAFMALIVLIGCGESGSPSSPASEGNGGVEPDRYTVRGVYRGTTMTPSGPQWQIEHERIEDFRMPDGSVEPMDVMVMPFPLADDVPDDPPSTGDKMEVDFEVRWTGPNRGYQLTAWRPLAPDTSLHLEPQTSATPGHEGHDHAGHNHNHNHNHDHDHHHDGHDHHNH